MLSFADVMESLMVICFGISWPINIAKAWKAKTAKGTSVLFYFFIWIGYVFAIVGKLCLIYYYVNIQGTADKWTEVVNPYVFFFYLLNTVMVTLGILIYFRNCHLDRKIGKETE